MIILVFQEIFLFDPSVTLSYFYKDKRYKSELIQNYKEWKFFLLTWKRCELLKSDWGRSKLGVDNKNNTEIFNRFK